MPPFSTFPLVSTLPSVTLAACVVIPARDEADSIERTLAALAAQRDLDGRPLAPGSFEAILVANNCRDRTASIARRVAERDGAVALRVVEVELPPERANVGAARRIAMDEACRRLLSVGRPRGVIATTDADTSVSRTWLAATLREVALGAEAVGGRILVAPRERRAMAPAVRGRFLRNVGYYALANEVMARVDPRPGDPWPNHEQFFGASLAITARTYRMVGGLPALPSGEDAALAHALLRADVDIRHSPAVRVRTSARLDGRTPAGLAALLAGWSDSASDDRDLRVPSAATVVRRATARRALRDLWRRARDGRNVRIGEVSIGDVARVAELADISSTWLDRALAGGDRFGMLLSEVEERAWRRRAPELVDVRAAIDELRAWLEPHRRRGSRPTTAGPLVAEALHMVTPPEPPLAPLEHVQPVGPLAAPLAPPPQVA